MTEELDEEAKEAAKRKKAADSMVASIVAGRVDDHIVRITQAIDARVKAEGGPRVRWMVEVDGASITQDQLSLGDGRWIEEEIRRSFESLQPLVIGGDRAVIAACAVARRAGISRAEALDKVDDIPLSEVKVSDLEVAPGPLETSSPST